LDLDHTLHHIGRPERLAVQQHVVSASDRQYDAGSRVGGYACFDTQRTVMELPAACMESIQRLVGRPSGREATSRSWTQDGPSIARLNGGQASQVAVHPVTNGAEGIMIERVHARRVEAVLRR